MMKSISISIAVLFFSLGLTAQVAINKTGAAPVPSAVLEVSSTTAGLLTPRMTSLQRISILTPPDGLIVYQTDGTKDFYYARGGVWNQLNAKQAVHNEVTMGATPIATPNGTFAAQGVTLANVGVGVMQVNHPILAGANIPIKIITPMYNEIPTPPVIPTDLCKPSFTSSCNTTAGRLQYQLSAGIFSPALGGAIPTASAGNEIRMCHKSSSGAYCPSGSGTVWPNYNYLGTASAFPSGATTCFGVPYQSAIYNNNTGIQPGESYEIMLKGNNYASNTPTYYNSHSIFIDWNQDADFFDAGETVYQGPLYWAGAASNTYFGAGHIDVSSTVPAQAVTGNCTMRIITSQVAGNNQPCLATAFGSTTDYDFKIANGVAPTYPATNAFCDYSNETTTSFRVRCYNVGGTPINTKVHILMQPF